MKRSLITLALAAILSWSAQASELSYSYVEGDYLHVNGDADSGGDSDNGYGLRGSLNFGSSDFYGFGGYNRIELGYSTHFDTAEVGVGYHYGLSERAHLIAEVAYANNDVEDFNVDTYRSSVGLRGLITDRLEGIAKVNYTDGSGLSGTASGTVGLLFKFNKTFGISGEVELFEQNVQIYTAGIRASF